MAIGRSTTRTGLGERSRRERQMERRGNWPRRWGRRTLMQSPDDAQSEVSTTPKRRQMGPASPAAPSTAASLSTSAADE